MSARPPSPEPPPEGENEVQRNIRLKVCAYCKKPGARLKCKACFQRTYCDKRCQKKDWKAVHREQCEKLQQVFVPPPAGWREAKEAAAVAATLAVEARLRASLRGCQAWKRRPNGLGASAMPTTGASASCVAARRRPTRSNGELARHRSAPASGSVAPAVLRFWAVFCFFLLPNQQRKPI